MDTVSATLNYLAPDSTRNRLSVLLSRTNHAAFHTGQAALIK